MSRLNGFIPLERAAENTFLGTIWTGADRSSASDGQLGINGEPDVALVRLWILESEDNSTECHLGPEAPNQTRCLHLVASAGHALNEHEDWSRLDGAFGRVPLGVGKIGLIAQSGKSILIPDISVDQRWVVRPEWVKQEAIRSFVGHPLKFRKEVLGVLGVFSRAQLTEK